jgi:putative membrane protein
VNETILAVAAGLCAGFVSGLTPGIHLNTLSQIASRIGPTDGNAIIGLIVAMNMMHVFLDFIPSVLIGAPHPDNYLSALPAHRVLLEGHGLDAIRHAVAGALLGSVIAVLLIPLYAQAAVAFEGKWSRFVVPVLVLSVALQFAHEKGVRRKAWAFVVLLLSAALGTYALSHAPDALFPLVTGFFGVPALLFGLHPTQPIPAQEPAGPLEWEKLIPVAFVGSLAGSLVTYFPALSPSHAAYLATSTKTADSRRFLCLLGSLGASATIYSFVALAVLGKARTGSAASLAAVHPLVWSDVGLVAGIGLLCAGIGALCALGLARYGIRHLPRLHSATAVLLVLGFMLALVGLWNGAIGLLICGLATAVGCIPQLAGVRRSHAMAFLIAPTLLYYMRL